jgi:hypothetical protein
MALAVTDSGFTADETDDGILVVDDGRCMVLIGFIVDAVVAESFMSVSLVAGLLYDSFEFNGSFSFICKLSFIVTAGLVTVSTILKYELFDGKVCGFDAGVDSGLSGNNVGCGEAGISDDCDINAIMDATCDVVDDGVTDVCDVKGNGGEGFGDEEGTVNCNNRVDKDEGADIDESGVNDNRACEDCIDDGVVGEECKDGRSLWMFPELLVVCFTSSTSDDAGDNGLLLAEASALFPRTSVEFKVTFFVTCAWIPFSLSPSSSVLFGTGPAGDKVD